MQKLTIVWGAQGPLEVNASTTLSLIQILTENGLQAGDRLTLVVNSGGGDFYCGAQIYGILRSMTDSGIEVRTHVDGIAASMGAYIHLGGEIRTMTPTSKIGLHSLVNQENGYLPASYTLRDSYHSRLEWTVNQLRHAFGKSDVEWFTAKQSSELKLTNRKFERIKLDKAVRVSTADPSKMPFNPFATSSINETGKLIWNRIHGLC